MEDVHQAGSEVAIDSVAALVESMAEAGIDKDFICLAVHQEQRLGTEARGGLDACGLKGRWLARGIDPLRRLVFTAGALDPHLRAFDTDGGKELRSGELPASTERCAKMGDAVAAFAVESRRYLVPAQARPSAPLPASMSDCTVQSEVRMAATFPLASQET